MPLRSYQTEAIQDINKAFTKHTSVLLQMPTGTGKTEVFCQLMREYMARFPARRIVVLVHRKELVQQIKQRLQKFGIAAGIVQGSNPFDINYQVHVCSINTLKNRNYVLENPSLIVIDEAHHAKADTYLTLIERYKGTDTHLLGVTATPVRLDGKALCDVFEQLLLSAPIRWFIEEGYLSKIRYYAVDRLSPFMLPVSPLTNDYEEAEAFKLMSSEKVMAEICTAYQRYAEGKKTLIFCVNQKHSQNLKKRFDDLGIESAIIDANTPAAERDKTLADFRNNTISILINVNIFTEGFDCPDIEAVILARPTKSLTLFLQMIGRVTRVAAYKPAGLVLDNADNFKEHGHPTSAIDWEEHFYAAADTNDWLAALGATKPVRKKKRKTPAETTQFEMVEITDPDFEIEEAATVQTALPLQSNDASSITSLVDASFLHASSYYRLYQKEQYELEIDFSYHKHLLLLHDEKLKRKAILKFCSELVMELSMLELQPGACTMKIVNNGKAIEKASWKRFNSIHLPPANYDDVVYRVFCFVWNTVK